jgi:hypothetical protein
LVQIKTFKSDDWLRNKIRQDWASQLIFQKSLEDKKTRWEYLQESDLTIWSHEQFLKLKHKRTIRRSQIPLLLNRTKSSSY